MKIRPLSIAFLIATLFNCGNIALAQRSAIDLSGSWSVSINGMDGEQVKAVLPGSLDTNGIGIPNDDYTETTQLSRKVTYTGEAYYTRNVEIPKDWNGKHIEMFIERTRPTTVWVDGILIGSVDYLSAPHVYDLTSNLSPGSHEIRVMVDNGERIPAQIRSNSHSCTEATQTNWNGMIGKLELRAMPKTHIANIMARPLTGNRVEVIVDVTDVKKPIDMVINVGDKKQKIKVDKGSGTYKCTLELGSSAQTWSERHPYLYVVEAELPGIDKASTKTGLVDFGIRDKHFTVNDTITFLRGKHDGCVFPLTGYVAMDVDQWRRYFSICKQYGINHVRFHSWCPPEACFEAADIEGIYLQPELTIWGTFNRKEEKLMEFLHSDGIELLRRYQGHPSFVLFSLGNELWGEPDLMDEFVQDFREASPRQYYAYGSNSYLGYKGYQPDEDFFVTCRVGGGDGYDGYTSHTRASFSFADAVDGGLLNHEYPNTCTNFEAALSASEIPVIGHETGQYQIYPNYTELGKYTGVLEPRNFAVFKQRLADACLDDQAMDFFKASGAWSAQLYKADIEMNMRTPSMAGFQILDLQDYPGQGTALVGILDAFMDAKGVVDPAIWRQSCSDIVLLSEMPKYCYEEGEKFVAKVAVANYSGRELAGADVIAEIVDGNGRTLDSYEMRMPTGQGYLDLGTIDYVMPSFGEARELSLRISIPSENRMNAYSLWVYPDNKEINTHDIIVTSSQTDAIAALNDGNKVLLMPKHDDVADATVLGLFITDYWNYRMFATISANNDKPTSPGTMGLLVDSENKALDSFPTSNHSDWQWFVPAKYGYPLILDTLNGIKYKPIVQVIDNVERNHRLGLVMEFAVGSGKLMLVMADRDEIAAYAEGRQLLQSILDYMGSDTFVPKVAITPDELTVLLKGKASDTEMRELRNISYD